MDLVLDLGVKNNLYIRFSRIRELNIWRSVGMFVHIFAGPKSSSLRSTKKKKNATEHHDVI